MKILVTGANGFIGKNLCLALAEKEYEVIKFDRDTKESLKDLVSKCDFVMHLAGINRPKNVEEFYKGNADLTSQLLTYMKEDGRKLPILITSSIQAERDNDYGKSKKEAEDYIIQYGKETGSPVYVYRLANAFGKWCRPNYNSVVATFCYNIANNLEITVNDPNVVIPFVYIDDIVRCIIDTIGTKPSEKYLSVTPQYDVKLGELADLLYKFKESRNDFMVPNMQGFEKKLYSTYLSYLPKDDFSYDLNMHVDQRGSFTEMLKCNEYGQVSVNIAHPGIVKGNHWHHTKNEKFIVVSGTGVIRFRKIGDDKVITYHVSGEKLEVVDIPVGYTHNIENTGDTDMVTVMWCNELFDPENPDTYYEEV